MTFDTPKDIYRSVMLQLIQSLFIEKHSSTFQMEVSEKQYDSMSNINLIALKRLLWDAM